MAWLCDSFSHFITATRATGKQKTKINRNYLKNIHNIFTG